MQACICIPAIGIYIIIIYAAAIAAKSLQYVRLCATLKKAAHQASLSLGFSRQEHWSGLPFPSAGDLPDPGIKPTSLMSPPLAGRFFTTNITQEAPIIPEGSLNLRERMYHLQAHILSSFGSLCMEDK